MKHGIQDIISSEDMNFRGLIKGDMLELYNSKLTCKRICNVQKVLYGPEEMKYISKY